MYCWLCRFVVRTFVQHHHRQCPGTTCLSRDEQWCHACIQGKLDDCVLLSVQCRVCCQLPTQAQTPPHLTSGNCISLHAFRNCPAAVFEHAELCFPHPILSMLSCAFLTQLNPAYSSLYELHQSLGSFHAVCAASWWALPLT